eukprot:6023034-Prymnesium_polylepis.1
MTCSLPAVERRVAPLTDGVPTEASSTASRRARPRPRPRPPPSLPPRFQRRQRPPPAFAGGSSNASAVSKNKETSVEESRLLRMPATSEF